MSPLNLTTPEEMYNYCIDNYLGKDRRKSAIANFELLCNELKPDERIYSIFIAQRTDRKSSSLGMAAYAITDKRFIMAQKLFVTTTVLSVSIENINGLTKSGALGISFIHIDTREINVGTIYIITLSKYVEETFDSLNKAIQYSQQQSFETFNPIEKIKGYKELLDLGIITEREYLQKKRDLLGL